jgi:hypothetical protein
MLMGGFVIAVGVAVKLTALGEWGDAREWWRRERQRRAAGKRWR